MKTTRYQFHAIILTAAVLFLFAGTAAYGSDIYVTSGNTIQKIDSSGNKTTFASGLASWPSCLAFDRSGFLYAAYDSAGLIDKFDSSGHKTTVATGLTLPGGMQLGPEGLAFDSSGNLYTAIMNQGTILKFDSSGNKSTFATGLSNPAGLAFDGSGNLYVSAWNQGTIFKFDSNGNNKTTFASGPSGIESLAFDSHGNLYASMDNFLGKGSIEKFAPGGGTGTVFASSASLNSPFGIAFDGSDNLYVACYGGNSIVKLDPAGNMSTVASVQNTLGVAIQIPEPATLLLLGLGAASRNLKRFPRL
jgi:sugar lactone lactonase YvrE